MHKNTYFIVIIITTALAIGIWRERQENPNESIQQFSAIPLKAGTFISHTHKISPFQLINMQDEPFTQHAFKNRWSLILFGYTACPHICPTFLHNMQQIAGELKGAINIQYLFVTISPEKDTAAHLKTYLEQPQFKGILGVTGEKHNILKLANSLGAYISDEPSPEHIEHSGTLFLVNPQGKLAGVFSSNEKPIVIANDLKEIAHRFAQGSE